MATAAGGALRLDFHLGVSRTDRGRRAYTVSLLTDLGATLDTNAGLAGPGFAWALYPAFGYAWY